MSTAPLPPKPVTGAGSDPLTAIGLKDVKVRSSSTLKVAEEDSYAVSPRAPLLTTDLQNNAFLCGEARFGQLGTGVRPVSHHRPVPTPLPQSVAGDNSWAVISLGSFHAAAITSQGKLYTWGLNSKGQCGVVEPDPADRGRITYYPGPARVKSSTTGGTYKAVACGGEHTVALGSRGVSGWGNNCRGQLGLGIGAPQVVWRPLLLPSLSRLSITQLVCGSQHTLALTAQSQVLAWGANDLGQLGVSDTSDRHTPTPVEGLWGLPIVRLAAGDAHSMALTTTGQLFTWGSNSHGQCGIALDIYEEDENIPEEQEDEGDGVDDDNVEGSEPSLGAPGPFGEPVPLLSPAGGVAGLPSPATGPPECDPAVKAQWSAVMQGMGIAPDVADMCLHITGYRGVEVAVDWLFSQAESDVALRLERWHLMQQRSTPPASQGASSSGAAAMPGASGVPPLPPPPAAESSGGSGSIAEGPPPSGRPPRSRLARAVLPGTNDNPGLVSHSGSAATGPGETGGDHEVSIVVSPTLVDLQGVRHMSAGLCTGVAVTEHGDVYTWGLGTWGALGHGDTSDRPLPTWVEALESAVIERVSCGQYHTAFVARDGTVYGCGRCDSGQLGRVPPGAVLGTPATGSAAPDSSILVPIQLELTASLIPDPASSSDDRSPFAVGASGGRGNGSSDGLSDSDNLEAGAGGGKGHADSGSDGAQGSDRLHRVGATPSPAKTIVYDPGPRGPPRTPASTPGVVLHEVVSGGCNTAVLLRRQQEAPSPWQVTLLAKLQAAVARSLALQNSGTGPTAALAVALRNVARGASLVLSSPAALCAAFAVRPRLPPSPSFSLPDTTVVATAAATAIPGAVRTPSALNSTGVNPIFGSATASHSPTKRAAGGASAFAHHALGRHHLPGQGSRHSTPKLSGTARTGHTSSLAPSPLPLPLDVQQLDQLYCNLLELSGVSKEPALLGALNSEYDQGPAMCELQRYGLQQALLRCGLTLCEDLMAHAPLLRSPERAQVLLAALHCPLLCDPASCKQLLPKLCHAVLAAPAAARRLMVRWWASYPPDLLLERLVQPMQAYITKELAAVKKLTSSIMAVIKVLARVEAANQLAGGMLGPEAFYNTLISEKMDVQDHYSAWRTTQDLGGGLPGVRPVTNTSGAQYYACEPDSDSEPPASAIRLWHRTASSNGARHTLRPTLAHRQATGGSANGAVSGNGASGSGAGTPPAAHQAEGSGSTDAAPWDAEAMTEVGMRMSDPGRHSRVSNPSLPQLHTSSVAQAQGAAPTRRTTFTGSTSELQRRQQASEAAIAHRNTVDASTLPHGPHPNAAAALSGAARAAASLHTAAALANSQQPAWPEAAGGGRRRSGPGLPPLQRNGAPSPAAGSPAPTGAAPHRRSASMTGEEAGSAAHRQHHRMSDSGHTHRARGPSGTGQHDPRDGDAAPAPAPAPRPVTEPGPFSFCTYPFLLDARAKSNLLHIEARFQMEQTVAHARMEQQLYGQHARFGRNDSGSRVGRASHSESGAGGSTSGGPGGTYPGEDLMMHVLDKVQQVEDLEDEDGEGSTGSRGQSGSGGASGSGGRGRGRSTKGFRGLLAALWRGHGPSRTGSMPEPSEQDSALVPERRAESFRLPRPRECTMPGTHSDMCIIRVRRTHLVEDALDEITRQTRRDLFKPLRVHFIGEEGIDAGGVKKEFFALLLAELLRPEYGLMEIQPDTNTFWFPEHSLCSPSQYQLLGLVLGLAVYNRVLLDFPLPMAAYKKLLSVPVGLRDLTELSPPLGNSLKQLLELEGPPGTVEDLLCLSWAVERQAWGVRTVTELVPGGEELPVTEDNRESYVECMVDYHLNTSIRWQFDAFARGFGVLCNGPALRLFNAQELERLVCGNPTLDWAALQRNAKYEGGYTASSQVCAWLWDLVRAELLPEEKKRFLKFFTGSDRAPIGGLGTLRCLIQRAGPDSERLPTSHTCFNTLLLPEYTSRAKLARQLRTAINNAEGFGLE